MKSSTLILYFAVWSISLAAAYYIGSHVQGVALNTNQAVKVPLELEKPKFIQASAIEEVTTNKKNALTAYLGGDVSLLEDAFLEIPTLSGEATRELLVQAFDLPASDPNRSRLIRDLLRQLAETEPVAALEVASQMKSLRDTERARVAVLEVWGRKDSAAAIAWANNALVDEPPTQLRDGGIIRDGHSEALDELRDASRSGKQWIAEMQASERKRTGIDTLKIKFNNVFGYFIEITKAKADQAPDDYQRKQTMANAERFITPELKEVEGKVLGADDRAKSLEYDEFIILRRGVTDHLVPLQNTADALATLDVLISFAETAQLYQHTRPVLDESRHLQIVDGRHPVLEQTLVEEKFVPNDTLIDPEQSLLQILTGPNMAGKSTYIRQIALITLMAQIGAYVPAEHAHTGLTDRIFCRVGASDDLAKGQSTFMVEMNETSLIVNNATEHSLVILDEIGRGTATFDGLSIAWSVAEHLHDEVRCRTLFATHYHELCALSDSKDAVANFNVAVREWNDDIIFLRKILPGQADKSYGIQVARLAGLPKNILDRAKEILSHLEMSSAKPTEEKQNAPKAKKALPEANSPQMNLFD